MAAECCRQVLSGNGDSTYQSHNTTVTAGATRPSAVVLPEHKLMAMFPGPSETPRRKDTT